MNETYPFQGVKFRIEEIVTESGAFKMKLQQHFLLLMDLRIWLGYR